MNFSTLILTDWLVGSIVLRSTLQTQSSSEFAASSAVSEIDLIQNGPEARRIAATIPYYPFHGAVPFTHHCMI
jgi:hypothetical protein